ncbi:TonB-dependent receptor [Sinomicrobium sp. M5D2P17]
MKKLLILCTLIIHSQLIYSQNIVTGTVNDENGTPLAGVNVVEKGTSNGTSTDFDGKYEISVSEGAILVFSYIGFTTSEIKASDPTLNVTLSEGVLLDEVQLVGSRSPKRTATDTPVAVDVIDLAEVTAKSGQIEINQILQYAAPSFNAGKQSGSDGADHVDPASLRGLGPDQTLVLINGKRRHQSSLINLFGTRGRGNTGTDLNAIPAAAIKRIEILRDGASAQYGSDAIAGVINIVLKNNTDELTGSVSYGAYNTNANGDFYQFGEYGQWNTDGYRLSTSKDGNQLDKDKDLDGGSIRVAANYGVGIGEGGFANITTEYIHKNKTLRPTFDFRKGFGEAAVEGFNVMLNAAVPVTDKTEIYLFGGRNYRDTDAFAFTRNNPTERNVTEIYPDGFTPRITSNITDNSISAGVRTETESGWKIDINNTWGKNNFHYFIKGTLNASLGALSPTDFDAGGHSLSQNTTGVNFSKYYDNVLHGMNLAFGMEYRTENFSIFAGEEGSWATYDENGVVVTDPSNQTIPTVVIDGEEVPRPGGSQGFPGYGPANEVDRNRSNISLYADGEFDLSDRFLIAAAARFENYSDFGSTLNGKLAARFKVSDNINLRASASTGFRAPSLAQIYYNLRFTDFQGGVAVETLLSPNNSPVTKSFGIDNLNEEKALNAAIGITAGFGEFTATIDGYWIKVNDRIVLTGNFPAPQIENVEQAQFFVNGADTETKGVDIILSWKRYFGESRFSAILTGNINDMKIKKVHNNDLDEQIFFGERDKAFLLASAPENKFNLNLNYGIRWFDINLALTRFSKIELLDWQMFEDVADYNDNFDNQITAATDTYDPKIVTDLNLGFQLNQNLKLNIGSNNLFNIYPTQQDDWSESGGYWDSVQMGFSGAFYYARLNLNF